MKDCILPGSAVASGLGPVFDYNQDALGPEPELYPEKDFKRDFTRKQFSEGIWIPVIEITEPFELRTNSSLLTNETAWLGTQPPLCYKNGFAHYFGIGNKNILGPTTGN